MADFMDDIEFDVNEITETGAFGFDNDFNLDDVDEQEQPFEEEPPPEEFNMPLQTADSEDSQGSNVNDMAIDDVYDQEDEDDECGVNLLDTGDEGKQPFQMEDRAARGSIFAGSELELPQPKMSPKQMNDDDLALGAPVAKFESPKGAQSKFAPAKEDPPKDIPRASLSVKDAA